MKRTILTAGALFVCVAVSFSQETEATRLLNARNAEFTAEVIKVTGNVYTAVGYSVQPVSMIVGDEGIIIVDTGMDTTSAEKVLGEFRKITHKPVEGIILTHGHGDHTGGIPVFAREGSPPIWARHNFGRESKRLKSVGLTINVARGARQGGFKLPPDKRINNGIARAYYPKRGGEVFGASGKIKPTHLFTGARRKIQIAGVTLHLVVATGETHDALYVWYPAKRVLFSGDNYYKSWPNLYPIRGAPYRDINEWANTVDRMLKEEPDFLVPGHTRPIAGKDRILALLTDYRDAIRFVFDKTIEGMNKGLTPDELVDYVRLPERFRDKDHLRPYYGNPEWAVRSIFNGYLGWFDGNPSNLFPLSPKDEAQRVAALAGGEDLLLAQTRAALKKGDFQWTAQLCDHLLALDPTAKEPKLIKAGALEAIAQDVLSGIGRNYYLTVAQELRKDAEQDAPDEVNSHCGYVGLRPLPRTKEMDHGHNHGGSWAGTPTFAEQKGKYPFVAENLDVVKGWLEGDFKTRRMFFEYYWGLSAARDDLDPEKNQLVKTIAAWESKGGVVEQILICREYRLAIHRGHRDAKPGPFEEDTRILFAEDVDDIRAMFRGAHEKGLIKHGNYKLIQMVEEPAFFAENEKARAIMEKMEGVAYECHQFNRHWPLETGWSKPDRVVKGAKWTLAQGKEYIFYYGPIIWKSPHYYAFIERDWLETYWKAGLPKQHPKMHYYLNTFPHAHGRGRPVGPESDPHSILGFTKWLIEEIKRAPHEKREPDGAIGGDEK